MPARDNGKPALLIGRWLTPHKGHYALVEEAIKRYGSVIIAVRDTDELPATWVRRVRLEELLRPLGVTYVDIITIPDISAVIYGRDVGYDVVKIELSEELEAVRGADIRSQHGEVSD